MSVLGAAAATDLRLDGVLRRGVGIGGGAGKLVSVSPLLHASLSVQLFVSDKAHISQNQTKRTSSDLNLFCQLGLFYLPPLVPYNSNFKSLLKRLHILFKFKF